MILWLDLLTAYKSLVYLLPILTTNLILIWNSIANHQVGWNAVADPGFPRREAPTLEFMAKTYYLERFLPKTAWKWNQLDEGHASLAPPWTRQWNGINCLTGNFFSHHGTISREGFSSIILTHSTDCVLSVGWQNVFPFLNKFPSGRLSMWHQHICGKSTFPSWMI